MKIAKNVQSISIFENHKKSTTIYMKRMKIDENINIPAGHLDRQTTSHLADKQLASQQASSQSAIEQVFLWGQPVDPYIAITPAQGKCMQSVKNL